MTSMAWWEREGVDGWALGVGQSVCVCVCVWEYGAGSAMTRFFAPWQRHQACHFMLWAPAGLLETVIPVGMRDRRVQAGLSALCQLAQASHTV